MNFRNINISAQMKALVRRFGVTLAFLCATSIVIPYVIDYPSKWIETLCYLLGMGTILSFVLQLISEELSDRNTKILLYFLPYAALLLDSLWVYFLKTDTHADDFLQAVTIGHVAMWILVISCGFIVPFWRHTNDRAARNFALRTMAAGVIGAVVAGGATLAVDGLWEGTLALFDITYRGKFLLHLNFFLYLVIQGCITLGLLPQGKEKHNEVIDKSRLALNVGRFVALPILVAYLVVLYVYLVKIILVWTLPDGMVSYLISAMMLAMTVVYFFLYDSLTRPDVNTFYKWLARLLPILTLPLLALMSIGIGRRISDYGITTTRLYVLSANLWFYAVSIGISISTFMKREDGGSKLRLHWVVLSAAGLFALSSCLPYANFTYLGNHFQRPQDPDEHAETKTWSDTHKTYYRLDRDHDKPCPIPEGYTHVESVTKWDHTPMHEKRDKQGRLELKFSGGNYRDQKKYTVYFDDTQKGDFVDLYTDDGELIRAYSLIIIDNEGKLYINGLQGYIFYK